MSEDIFDVIFIIIYLFIHLFDSDGERQVPTVCSNNDCSNYRVYTNIYLWLFFVSCVE